MEKDGQHRKWSKAKQHIGRDLTQHATAWNITLCHNPNRQVPLFRNIHYKHLTDIERIILFPYFTLPLQA